MKVTLGSVKLIRQILKGDFVLMGPFNTSALFTEGDGSRCLCCNKCSHDLVLYEKRNITPLYTKGINIFVLCSRCHKGVEDILSRKNI